MCCQLLAVVCRSPAVARRLQVALQSSHHQHQPPGQPQGTTTVPLCWIVVYGLLFAAVLVWTVRSRVGARVAAQTPGLHH